MSKYRRYPRAYNLEKLELWIRILYTAPVPLVEITTRKLRQKLLEDNIKADVFEAIIEWKKSKGIELSDESEYRYLLRDLGIINHRKLDPDVDFYLPLGGDGPNISSVVGDAKGVQIHYLTPIGRWLHKVLDQGNRPLYEDILFWLVFRNKVYQPVIQQVISTPDSYKGAYVESLIHLGDSVSLNCVLSWGRFFGVFARRKDGHNLLVETLSRRILVASILELNWFLTSRNLVGKDLLVREIVDLLSSGLFISPSAVDFASLLEVVFCKTHSIVSGYPSSRGDMSLPHKKNIQILRFQNTISLKIANDVRPTELLSFLPHAVEVTLYG